MTKCLKSCSCQSSRQISVWLILTPECLLYSWTQTKSLSLSLSLVKSSNFSPTYFGALRSCIRPASGNLGASLDSSQSFTQHVKTTFLNLNNHPVKVCYTVPKFWLWTKFNHFIFCSQSLKPLSLSIWSTALSSALKSNLKMNPYRMVVELRIPTTGHHAHIQSHLGAIQNCWCTQQQGFGRLAETRGTPGGGCETPSSGLNQRPQSCDRAKLTPQTHVCIHINVLTRPSLVQLLPKNLRVSSSLCK